MTPREELLSGGPPPATSAWLLVLAGVLGLGLLLWPRWQDESLLDWLPRPETSDAARVDPGLAEVGRRMAAGSYAEAWERLQELHEASPRHPRVNLELSRFHHVLASGKRPGEATGRRVRLELALEYAERALEVRPDWPAGRAHRARVALDLAEERLRAVAGWLRPPGAALSPRPERALPDLDKVDELLVRARASLPEEGAEGVDPATRAGLAADLEARTARARYEQAVALDQRGHAGDRERARGLLEALLAGTSTPESLRREAGSRLGRMIGGDPAGMREARDG